MNIDLFENQLNEDAIESATKQIHYYSYLPRCVKVGIGELDGLKPQLALIKEENCDPAYVVEGAVTIINGRLNIPDLNVAKHSFLNKNVA